MRQRNATNVLRNFRFSKPSALVFGFTLALMQVCSAVTFGQARNSSNPNTNIPVGATNTDRVATTIVFQSAALTVRRITVSPHSSGYHYRHPGGSIILLSQYPFRISIPLGTELDGELQTGDVLQIPTGDYVLDNPNAKPLDFLSIETRH